MSGENAISSVLANLSGGAGIDLRKLAEDLTNAERVPAEERLSLAKEKQNNQISAYAQLKYSVENFVAKLNTLDDVSEVFPSTASSADASYIGVSEVLGAAEAGSHDVSISALAQGQTNISNLYTSSTQSLNGGSGFVINLTDGAGDATNITIADGNDTPAGLVAAINSSGINLSASLLTLDTDATEFRIVLKGEPGLTNSFLVTSTLSDPDFGFHDSSNGNSVLVDGVYSQQQATNSAFTVNGVAIERASNSVTDVIDGVTLDLKRIHGSGSTSVTVEKDSSQLKSKLQDLVVAYNEIRYVLKEASDVDSADENFGGFLANDLAAVRQVRDVIYRAISQDSSTTSGTVNALRDIGIELTRNGDLEFNEVKFDSIMSTNADDVAVMLSAGTDNQSKYDGQPQGLARDIISDLEGTLTDSIDGLFQTRSLSSQKLLASYEEELLDLDVRMTNLFERYLSQFTVMETLVSQLNSTRDSLSDQWMDMGNFSNK